MKNLISLFIISWYSNTLLVISLATAGLIPMAIPGIILAANIVLLLTILVALCVRPYKITTE